MKRTSSEGTKRQGDTIDQLSAVLISGVQACGKSTVARLLAACLPHGIVIEGDELGGVPGAGISRDEYEFRREIRYRQGAALADQHHLAGATPIHADSIWGEPFVRYSSWVTTRPLLRVMLTPSVAAVAARVRARSYGYEHWQRKGLTLEEGIRDFESSVIATARVGLWIDTTELTPEQTVDEILSRYVLALEMNGNDES